MRPLLPPPRMRQCSAQSGSFLLGPDGPCGGCTWTCPALRRSHRARENRDQNKISSDQSVHGLRGTPAGIFIVGWLEDSGMTITHVMKLNTSTVHAFWTYPTEPGRIAELHLGTLAATD